MPDVLPSLVVWLQPFAQQMTRPTFASLLSLIWGWCLARRHHVTGALRALPDAGGKHFSAYHRVFAQARWDLDQVGLGLLRLVLGLLPSLLPPGAPIFLSIDDTLCPRRSRRFFGVDSHYAPQLTGRTRSNANQSLKTRGHCWVVLSVILPLPFRAGHFIAIPLLFRLYMNHAGASRHHQSYRSKPDLAREMLRLVAQAFPQRRFHLLVDSAYGGQDTLKNLPAHCDLTARWITQARLNAPVEPRLPGQKGALRKRGPALPCPARMLEGRCPQIELDLYGRHARYRLASAQACLYTVPGRLVQVVATETLSASGSRRAPGARFPAAFYSTDLSASPQQILSWYSRRWSTEVMFHDAKQQLGMGQPQGYSPAAARRTSPTLMLLYGVVALWFIRDGQSVYRPALWDWYRAKPRQGVISFADMLATLRQNLLAHHWPHHLETLDTPQGSEKARQAIATLVQLAA